MSKNWLAWGKILSYLDFFQTKEIKSVVTGVFFSYINCLKITQTLYYRKERDEESDPKQ